MELLLTPGDSSSVLSVVGSLEWYLTISRPASVFLYLDTFLENRISKVPERRPLREVSRGFGFGGGLGPYTMCPFRVKWIQEVSVSHSKHLPDSRGHMGLSPSQLWAELT